MKISDGNWLICKDLNVINPIYVYEVQKQDNQIVVYVAPKDISSREYQLDTPLFTYTFTAPNEDIIGVKIEHFKGIYDKGPNFDLNIEEENIDFIETEDKLIIRNKKTTVEVAKNVGFKLDFYYDGKLITTSDEKSSGYIQDSIGKTYVFDRLSLSVGENVYGLGERFTSFVKNGQTVDIWNRDGGTSTEQAYKNIPFYLTNKGYGVFVNSTDKVSYEVASEKVSSVQFSVEGECLEYFVIGGNNPKDVLSKYTRLTGRSPILPAWSFGLWLTTSFTTEYDEDTVNYFIDGMRKRNIPLHVFHFDCFWMKGLHWCDFTWDKDVFPNPKKMLANLKSKGLKICVWINPYISQQSKLFTEGKENHYFIETKEGNVWQWDKWQPGQAIVDFTNPKACKWYARYLEELLDMGVDCFKTDFGERIPTNVKYYNDANPYKMHNYYTFLYNKLVFEVIKKKKGEAEAILFARSATVGGQQFPVHWGGDCYGNYESMAESLRGGLSLCLSGFSFWSHDMGGFETTASSDVYKRWCAFGLLSTHSRLHGSHSYRVPWAYDEEAVDVVRFFTNLKCKLMPYIYNLSGYANETGIPVMRAMLLEFPDDIACDYLDKQYMLGNSLLIAPVFNANNKVKFYLPKGKWTSLLTNEEKLGEKWYEEEHNFLSLPLYVREHTILVLGYNDKRPDYDYTKDVEIHLFGLLENKIVKTEIRDINNDIVANVSAIKKEGKYSIKCEGLNGKCKFIIHNTKLKNNEMKDIKYINNNTEIIINMMNNIEINIAE